MSLSRDEWAQLWNSIKKIEHALNWNGESLHPNLLKELNQETKFIKEKIQQVIGQME